MFKKTASFFNLQKYNPDLCIYSIRICSKQLFNPAFIIIISDYLPRPHLDRYDPDVVDDADYDELSADARAAAERAMRKRDRQEALTQGRMRPGLLYGLLLPW